MNCFSSHAFSLRSILRRNASQTVSAYVIDVFLDVRAYVHRWCIGNLRVCHSDNQKLFLYPVNEIQNQIENSRHQHPLIVRFQTMTYSLWTVCDPPYPEETRYLKVFSLMVIFKIKVSTYSTEPNQLFLQSSPSYLNTTVFTTVTLIHFYYLICSALPEAISDEISSSSVTL